VGDDEDEDDEDFTPGDAEDDDDGDDGDEAASSDAQRGAAAAGAAGGSGSGDGDDDISDTNAPYAEAGEGSAAAAGSSGRRRRGACGEGGRKVVTPREQALAQARSVPASRRAAPCPLLRPRACPVCVRRPRHAGVPLPNPLQLLKALRPRSLVQLAAGQGKRVQRLVWRLEDASVFTAKFALKAAVKGVRPVLVCEWLARVGLRGGAAPPRERRWLGACVCNTVAGRRPACCCRELCCCC
jgi:hypothetical protein